MTGWKSAEVADEVAEGEINANLEAILADEKDTGDVMLACERAGIDEDDGGLYGLLARHSGTDALREARKTGDNVTMNAATGLSESRSEATGYDRLINSIRPAAQNVLCRGPMGSGKTGTLIEIIRQAYRDGVIDKIRLNTPVRGMSKECLERASEINDVPEWWLDEDENEQLGELYPDVQFVFRISEYLEFAKEPGEKFALLDEFSSSGNSYVNSGKVEATLSPAMKAFRKSPNGSMRSGYVGHANDTDTAKLVRVSANTVIQKDGKADNNRADLATVYEDSQDVGAWTNYKKQNSSYRVRGIKDVPDSSPWSYHSNYFAHIEWDLEDPQNQIEHGKLREDWRDFPKDDDDDADDPGSAGEEAAQYVSCRGSKADGDACGATVTHISGFCHAHRAQWQGDDDPRMNDDDEFVN